MTADAAHALLAAFGAEPVFLHAHPDDESISTGGTIAALVSAGARPVIITGTRGERGEVVPGPWADLEGSAALGPHRESELASALHALGDPVHAWLGTPPARDLGGLARSYADSGMRWGSDGFAEAAGDADQESLSLAPIEEVTADVLAGIRMLAPDVSAVVGYDELGGYGHPDHVRMHEAGLAAAAALGVPYFAIVEPRVPGTDGGPDVPAVCVDLAAVGSLGAKLDAMAAHATQLTIVPAAGLGAADAPEFVLSGGQRHPVGVTECFRPADRIVRFDNDKED